MIDSTVDLGELKAQLSLQTNKKTELNGLLREAGTNLTEAKKNTLDCVDAFQKIKNQIKCCEDAIKGLKTLIRTESECGS